jgi:hypothetical protein
MLYSQQLSFHEIRTRIIARLNVSGVSQQLINHHQHDKADSDQVNLDKRLKTPFIVSKVVELLITDDDIDDKTQTRHGFH